MSKEINKNIEKVYNKLYFTYLIELRSNEVVKSIYTNVNEINYLNNLSNYNNEKIEELSTQFDINNVFYTPKEKKFFNDSRTTKYISYINIKNKIETYKIKEKAITFTSKGVKLLTYLKIIIPLLILLLFVYKVF